METARTKNGSTKTGSLVLNLGPLQIHYYGITLALAIVVGYLVARIKAVKFGIERAQLDDVAFWLIIWSIVGARLYYVIFYPEFFRDDLLEIFKIWHGGQSIYGALIAGALTLWYFARKTKTSFWQWGDLLAFALPLAQGVGRLGNFFNYEAFGSPTNLPWKMFVPEQYRPVGYAQYEYFHPAFAYEMIWNVFVFLVFAFVEKRLNTNPQSKFNFRGIFLGLYLVLYSIGRFFIEGIRLDSAYFGFLRGDQITALCLIIAGLAIIRYRYVSQASN